MKRKSTLLVTILLTVAMVFTMSASGFAEENPVVVDETPVVINQDPYIINDLTLDEAKHGVGLDGTGTVKKYIANYEYNANVAGIMSLEVLQSQSDKMAGVVSGEILINGKPVDANAAKSFPVAQGVKYSIGIIRTYEEVQANPYVAILVKAVPEDITTGFTTEFTNEQAGKDFLTKYYKFTPARSGGYELEIAGLNEETIGNQFIQIAINNSTGKMLNESVNYDESQKSCKMKIYLTGNTDYIIRVRDEKVDMTGSLENMKYTFTLKKLSSSEGLSVSGGKTLQLNTIESCTLSPFINKRAFTWYSFTAAEDGYYEFVVNPEEASATQSEGANDIIVELRDEDFSPAEEEEQMYLYSGEGGTIIKRLREGETCYLQVCELYRGSLAESYTRELVVKKHEHITKVMVDGDHVTIACPCMEETWFESDFWLDSVTFNNVVYNGGKEVLPIAKFAVSEWTTKDGNKPSIPDTAYTIKITSKNKTEVGKATAKLTFVGAYEDLGSFTASYKIIPAGTTVKSVVGGTKAVTVKWAKKTKQTTGYQIQYSTSSSFKSAKTVTVSKNTTTSKKISKLKDKKNYYVRVRTYKTVSKTKYYSAWSNVIKAKTK